MKDCKLITYVLLKKSTTYELQNVLSISILRNGNYVNQEAETIYISQNCLIFTFISKHKKIFIAFEAQHVYQDEGCGFSINAIRDIFLRLRRYVQNGRSNIYNP